MMASHLTLKIWIPGQKELEEFDGDDLFKRLLRILKNKPEYKAKIYTIATETMPEYLFDKITSYGNVASHGSYGETIEITAGDLCNFLRYRDNRRCYRFEEKAFKQAIAQQQAAFEQLMDKLEVL